jgi:predicted nucleic acid-binding protein
VSNNVRYWDSCVYLRFLTRQEGWETVRAILAEVESGVASAPRIATCSFTLAEVLNRKGGQRVITPEDFAVADDLLADPRTKSLIPADIAVCRAARDLVFEDGLKPADAIHLAAALSKQIPVLETFDSDLLDFADRLAGRIVIRRPVGPSPQAAMPLPGLS